jgi:hypothetical protein
VIPYDYTSVKYSCLWCDPAYANTSYLCSCLFRNVKCTSPWCPVDDELDPGRSVP